MPSKTHDTQLIESKEPADQQIRSPTGQDISTETNTASVEIDVELSIGEESIGFEVGPETVENAIDSAFAEQQRRRDRNLATKALERYPDADIVVVNEITEEVIQTAADSQELAEELSHVDYNPDEALIIRRDEYQ